MTKNIFISVIIPTRNRASTIERALQSVFNQTHQNFEIIVVDDASTDNTSEILEKFFDKIRYERLAVNSGGAVARNHGAKLAKGTYVAFLDSDDEWLPDCLEKKVALLQAQDADGVFGDFYKYSENKGLVRRKITQWTGEQSLANYILSGQGDCRTSTLMFKKDTFTAILFDENLQKHQDWDLGIRFSQKYKLQFISEPLTIIHDGDISRMSAKMNHKASTIFIEKHRNNISKDSLFRFYLFQSLRTFLSEGKTSHYLFYYQSMRKYRSLLVIKNIKAFRLYVFSLFMRLPWLASSVFKRFY